MTSDAKDVLIETRDGGVVTLVLNAPEKRNALIAPIREGLIEALTRLDGDEQCRAIVLHGAGGSFCAGGDISNPGPFATLEVAAMTRRPQRLVRAVAQCSKPVIAAVDGHAFGAGFGLAACCDFVVADEASSFCAAYGRVGVMPDVGLLWSLPQRVGIGLTREIVMFAEVINGRDAKEMGIADWLAEPGKCLELAQEKAEVLATKATASIAMTKALLAKAPVDMETVLTHEALAQAVLSGTEDAREGLLAFSEKRKPVFRGR